MSTSPHSMPMVSIRPGYVTFYSESTSTRRTYRDQAEPPPLPEQTIAAGIVSDKAGRRMSQAIDWMLYLAKPKPLYPERPKSTKTFRVNFITLTLCAAQLHDDNTIKKEMLQPFLDTLRKSWGCSKYLWRAEAQLNGNIHFHIITDVYVEWWKIRNRWNAIQQRLGYVSRFRKKHGHSTPNSTDVHSVNKIRNLASYFRTYFMKNAKGRMYTACQIIDGLITPCYNPSLSTDSPEVSQKIYRAIGGKLWGLSYSLSRIRSVLICTHDIMDGSLERFWELYKAKRKEYDFHTCVYVPVSRWAKAVQGELYTAFEKYLEQYQNLHPPPDYAVINATSGSKI